MNTNSKLLDFFNKIDTPISHIVIFLLVYSISTLLIWNRYEFNPTSMINFGIGFAQKNKEEVPSKAIVHNGNSDGYDGQIFYYYSRTISNLNTNWPVGFDESYRAPRIGFPLMISIFGFLGKYGTVFGMYFINLFLFLLSFYALRSLLSEHFKGLSILYLLSPFSLGSYSVLVSDSVMVSLVLISYYFYRNQRFGLFIPIASLAILTKEPALFFFFPLGLKTLIEKDFKKSAIIASILILPIFWHVYLKFTFPSWKATRLTDFILPFEGIYTYLKTLFIEVQSGGGVKELARSLSRFPLLLMFLVGVYGIFTGLINRGYHYRIGLALCFFMVGTAGYNHFWSVYENISRMFTISIPLFILLKNEDKECKTNLYFLLSIFIFGLFMIKLMFIMKVQQYMIWN